MSKKQKSCCARSWLIKFEHDHIQPFEKSDSTIGDVFEEMRKCRVLCVSCRLFVTHAQNYFGITSLKKAGYSQVV